MKVLFCSKTYPFRGGVECWLADLLPGLQQRGYEVTLALAKGHRFHDSHRYLATYPELHGVPVRILDGTSGVAQGRCRAIESLLRRERPDIVVPVMLHEVLSAVSARRKAGQAIRIAYPAHEDGIWVFRAIKEYGDQIDAVISASWLFLDALNHFLQWPINRLFHVQYGASMPTTTGTSRSRRGSLRLGYCGKLAEEQKRTSDLAILCEALEFLDVDYQLRIAGSGDGAQFLSERLKRQISDGRVVLLGWKSQEQLYQEFYPQIDALIITSDWETGPMVAWEAMMHGALVVTSQYRGLRREGIFRHRENALIFPVGHPEQVAGMLKDFCHDRERFAIMAETGRQLALSKFSVAYMIESWGSALSNVGLLPSKSIGTRRAYSDPATAIGWLEHWTRLFLRRPYHHANEHAEWPRYHPGHVSVEEQARWVEELGDLESDRQSASEHPVGC